jgi:hypothetical protein
MSKLGTLILVSMVMAFTAANVWAVEIRGKADGINVRLSIPGDTFEPGEIKAKIYVTDDKGAEVTDARVSLYYGMPPMEGMPDMTYKASATPSGGAYESTLYIDMMGDWFMDVSVKRDGKSEVVKLEKHFMNKSDGHDHMH